jgi:hypothetical protein
VTVATATCPPACSTGTDRRWSRFGNSGISPRTAASTSSCGWPSCPGTAELTDEGRRRLRLALDLLRASAASPGRDLDDWAHESNCEWAGVETAQILAELRVGVDCLIAGLLYRAVREERTDLATIEQHFGKRVTAAARCAAHGGDRRPAQSQ